MPRTQAFKCIFCKYRELELWQIESMADKLFAIPWQALSLRPHEHSFTLAIPNNVLENAEGSDKDNWPLTYERLVNIYLLWISTLLADGCSGAHRKRETGRNRCREIELDKKEVETGRSTCKKNVNILEGHCKMSPPSRKGIIFTVK